MLNAKNDYFIIISDIDEIPNLKKINFKNELNKILIFNQKMFYYKLNLFYKELIWTGSRACIKSRLKFPQWFAEISAIKKGISLIIIIQSCYILKFESWLSFKKVFTVFRVKFWNDAPNLPILLIIKGGIVIIEHPQLLAWV